MPEWKSEGETAEAAGWRLTIADGEARLTSASAGAFDLNGDPYEQPMSVFSLRAFAALLNEGADRLEGKPIAAPQDIVTKDQPVGTVVRDGDGDLWKRGERGWVFGGSAGFDWEARVSGWPQVQKYAPITLVSRP